MNGTFIGRTQHPSKWAGTPYYFDSTLSQDLLDRFTTGMDYLSSQDQSSIGNIAQGYGEVYTIARALKEAMGPDLTDRAIEAAESEQSFHVALAAPLMVWCLNNPWPQELDVDLMVSKWVERTLDSRSSSSAIQMANTFMAQLLPLVPAIREDARAPFLSQLLQKLYRCATPWKNPQHADLCAHYLELSHALTLNCGVENHDDGRAMIDVWTTNACLALDQTRAPEQDKLAAWLATSVLPAQDLTAIFSWSSGPVWACPEVVSFLLPHLPQSEPDRFKELPWSVREANAIETNQALTRAYCPFMYPLIELAVQPDDWKDQDTIGAWFMKCQQLPEGLPLPDDLSLA